MSLARTMREQRAKLVADAQAIIPTDSTQITPEIRTKFDKMMADADILKSDIDRAERAEALATETRAVRQPENNLENRDSAKQNAELEQRALSTYVRQGISAVKNDSELRTYTGLNVATGSQGEFTIPTGFQKELETKAKAYGGMLQVARILNTSTGAPIQWPAVDDTTNKGRWLAEANAVNQTNPTFSQATTLGANLASTDQVLVSIQLLQDSAFDFQALLSEEFGVRIGRLTNDAYTVGTGTTQPSGVIGAAGTTITAVGDPQTGNTSDNSVGVDDLTNVQFRVAASPAAGQYSVNTSTGTYSFATTDHFKPVLITWQQKDPTANDAAAFLQLSFSNGVEGQAPWTYLSGAHADAAIGYSGIATVQDSALQLGTDAGMPQLNYEIIGSLRASGDTPLQTGGNIDCNPSDVLYDYLTNNLFGINFPTGNIEWNLTPNNFQNTSSLFAFAPILNAPGYNASAFWAANNYFISDYIDNQTTVSAQFAKILEAGQTAVIWSEGLLKLRPYGDTSAAGNGFGYVPMTQPVFDLNENDFLANAGEEPITVNRDAWSGKYNISKIQFSNRLDDYNSDTIQEEDLASVQAYGKREEDPQDCSDFIRASWVAQWVCKMRAQRLSNIRSTYNFTLPFNYGILEPMDIVTITYVGNGFSFNKLPVRITKIENDRKTGLKITAEDFPYGVAKATLYPKQTNLDATPSPTLQEPGNATPLILELPNLQTGFQGYTYRIYATPVNPSAWGGCQVYLSGDNAEYDLQGQITDPALTGVLSGAFDAANLIPDSLNTGATWTGDASLVWTGGIDGGLSDGGFKYVGTGAASTFRFQKSQTLTVTPLATYTLSAWIDATHVTSTTGGGSPIWEVTDSAIATTYASVGQTLGQAGWLSVTFTVPSGVTTVRVICDTNNCTVASGQPLIFSDPQLMHTVSLVCDNNLQLLPSSDFDFSTTAENSLLAIVDASGSYEIVAYHDAVLTGVNTYQIGNFQRGLFGTTAGSHLTGVKVVKMSQGHLEQTYPASLVGANAFCKLTSFNTVGAREQDINSVSPLTFTFTGAFPGFFDQETGDVFNSKFVRNGGFEAGDHDWTKETGFTIIADSNAYSGTYVAKWTDPGFGAALRNSLLVPVQPASVYTANCMVKRTAGTGSGAVRISWVAQDGVTELGISIGTQITSSTYQNSRVQGTAPANAWYARVEGNGFTGGSTVCYFDAFELEDITQNASTSLNGQGSILPNQGISINFQGLPTMIIPTWVQQSLLRADSSSLIVNASGGANLVINGDGESGTVGSAAPNFTFFGGVSLLTANDFVHSGSKSLKFTHTAGNNSLSENTISLTAGVTYVVEGWIKTSGITAVGGHGAFLNCATNNTISSFTILTKFGAADSGQTTFPTIGLAATGSAQPFTFVQCYFIPATSGTMNVSPQMISANATSCWFDDVKCYPYIGTIFTGLSNSTPYHLYPYCQVSTGNVGFSNGNPPPTTTSDTFAQQANLDGRFAFAPCTVTTAASGATTPTSGSGGGSGSCPESNEPAEIQRYSDSGQLIFEGQIKVGEVEHGWESNDGKIKRGDFLKGYSFAQQKDVYRAVQKVMLVHCNGWVMLDGHRVTPCEPVYKDGWMPAWKVPGATRDNLVGWKVLIQVECDDYDEHNYYVGDLLIHNSLILPC